MDQDAIQKGIDTVVPFVTQYGMQVLGAVAIPFPQRDVHLFQNAPSS